MADFFKQLLSCCYDTSDAHEQLVDENERFIISTANKVSYQSNDRSATTTAATTSSSTNVHSPQVKKGKKAHVSNNSITEEDSERIFSTDALTQGVSTYVDHTEHDYDDQRSLLDTSVNQQQIGEEEEEETKTDASVDEGSMFTTSSTKQSLAEEQKIDSPVDLSEDVGKEEKSSHDTSSVKSQQHQRVEEVQRVQVKKEPVKREKQSTPQERSGEWNVIQQRLQHHSKEKLTTPQRPKITAERKKPQANLSEIQNIDNFLQSNRVNLPDQSIVTTEEPQEQHATSTNAATSDTTEVKSEKKQQQQQQKQQPLMLDLAKAISSRNNLANQQSSPSSPRKLARRFQVTTPDKSGKQTESTINSAQKQFSNEELRMLEKDIISWIESTVPDFHFDESVSFCKNLSDGITLCKLANALFPDTIDMKKVKMQVKSPFFATANIQLFLNACETVGLRKESLFTSQDLTQEKNLNLIIACLSQLQAKSN